MTPDQVASFASSPEGCLASAPGLPELEALALLVQSSAGSELAAAFDALVKLDGMPVEFLGGFSVYGDAASALLAAEAAHRKPAPAAPVLAVGMVAAMANSAVAAPISLALRAPASLAGQTGAGSWTVSAAQAAANGSGVAFELPAAGVAPSRARERQDQNALREPHHPPARAVPRPRRARSWSRPLAKPSRHGPAIRWVTARPRGPKALVEGSRYVVKPGDSLWTIATRFLGSGERWRQLWSWNRDRVHDPNLIHPGEILELQAHMVARGVIPQLFHGHRKVAGSFYSHRDGRLVWADTGAPVPGSAPAERTTSSPRASKSSHQAPRSHDSGRPARVHIVVAPPQEPASGRSSSTPSVPSLLAQPVATASADAATPSLDADLAKASDEGTTLGEISQASPYASLHALEALPLTIRKPLIQVSGPQMAGLSLLLPGTGQLLEHDWAGGIVDLAIEGAAVAAIVAGHSAGSAPVVTFGALMLTGNHALSPIDALERAHPQ